MPEILPLYVLLSDLEALRAACRRRGWEFRAGQRQYRWFGRVLDDRPALPGNGRCIHALGVPGCVYEVGLVAHGQGFLPAWDAGPEGGLDRVLGPNGGVLWQAYVTEVVRRAAARLGSRIGRSLHVGNKLRLRVLTSGCQSVVHVIVTDDGTTSLWNFSSGPEARYLADALGVVRAEEIILLEATHASHAH